MLQSDCQAKAILSIIILAITFKIFHIPFNKSCIPPGHFSSICRNIIHNSLTKYRQNQDIQSVDFLIFQGALSHLAYFHYASIFFISPFMFRSNFVLMMFSFNSKTNTNAALDKRKGSCNSVAAGQSNVQVKLFISLTEEYVAGI